MEWTTNTPLKFVPLRLLEDEVCLDLLTLVEVLELVGEKGRIEVTSCDTPINLAITDM